MVWTIPKIAPFHWGSRRPYNYMVPWAHMSQPPNDIWIGSAVYAYRSNGCICFSMGANESQKSLLPLGESGSTSNRWFLGPAPPGSSAQTASLLDQPFCRAHERDQQTDGQTHTQTPTDRPRYFVCICSGRLYR